MSVLSILPRIEKVSILLRLNKKINDSSELNNLSPPYSIDRGELKRIEPLDLENFYTPLCPDEGHHHEPSQ
jgi:hypothetical protein